MGSHFVEVDDDDPTLRIEGIFDGTAAAAALSWLHGRDCPVTIDLEHCIAIDRLSLESFERATGHRRVRIIGMADAQVTESGAAAR